MFKKILGLTCGLMLLAATYSYAQNPKKNTKIGAGAEINDGNENDFTSSFFVETGHEGVNDKFKIKLEYEYFEEDNVKDNEIFKVSEEYSHDISKSIYLFADSEIERNFEKELEHRTTVSVGPGIYFIKNKDVKISVDAGVSYILTKYNNMPADEDGALRAAIKADVNLIKNITLSSKLEYFPDVQDIETYRLKSEAVVEAFINEVMSIQVVGLNEYDNKPALENEHNDLSILTFLVYRF